METRLSPQWSLSIHYWSTKGGAMVVQGRQKHRSNLNTLFTTVRNFLRGDQWPTIVYPICDHGDAYASSYLVWAACELPIPVAVFVRLFWTNWKFAENHENTTSIASMARSERPVHHSWTTRANPLPPVCLQRRLGQFYSRTRHAQKSQSPWKGDTSKQWLDIPCANSHAFTTIRAGGQC